MLPGSSFAACGAGDSIFCTSRFYSNRHQTSRGRQTRDTTDRFRTLLRRMTLSRLKEVPPKSNEHSLPVPRKTGRGNGPWFKKFCNKHQQCKSFCPPTFVELGNHGFSVGVPIFLGYRRRVAALSEPQLSDPLVLLRSWSNHLHSFVSKNAAFTVL